MATLRKIDGPDAPPELNDQLEKEFLDIIALFAKVTEKRRKQDQSYRQIQMENESLHTQVRGLCHEKKVRQELENEKAQILNEWAEWRD